MGLGYVLADDVAIRVIASSPYTTLHRRCYKTNRIVVVIHR